MRKTIAEFMNENDYLVHCDMFNVEKFPTKATVIDCVLGESNAVNIAAGLADTNKEVYLYGVAGFIIHRYEQLKFSLKRFASQNGKVIIFNAGKIGYEGLGDGHKLDDDLEIMKILDIQTFEPKDRNELRKILTQIQTKPKRGIFYIQLGKDY